MIDLFRPYVPKEAIEEVGETLRTRWVGQGPKVDLFEKEFCLAFSVQNAVSMNSGTSALETAYDLCDLNPGDEVISTPLTCTATNLPLVRRGVKIVWADVLETTLCIDPLDVQRKITEKTKAIVQVHLGGIKADVKDIVKDDDGIPWKIPVVSDAAQALGVFAGDFTCCSFQAIKHITTLDGGMIVCPNASLAHRAKLLRWFGIDREKKIANNWQAYRERKMTFDIEEPGCKRHMHDISAVMGIVGLKHYKKIISHRENLFNLYRQELFDVSGVRIVDGPVNTYWLLTVLVEDRDNFARMLFEADVDTNVVQVRNDIYKIFGGKRADLPVLNALEERYLSLPLGMHVTEDDVQYICECIRRGW